jgi:hypothetical protein
MSNLPKTHPSIKRRPAMDSQAATATVVAEPETAEARSPAAIYWPIAVGVVLALMAPSLQQSMSNSEPWARNLVFPFVQIAGRTELGIGDLTGTLPQLILYLQFPFDGLITALNLKRGTRLTTALLQVFFLHGVGAFVLWLLSQTPVAQQ